MKTLLSLGLIAFLPLAAYAKPETYKADTDQTKIIWEGKKIIGGAHNGELKLKSGSLSVDKNQIRGGEFVIDMTSLKNTDLTDEGMNKKLVGHLNSDDFFSVDKHPTSTVKINKVVKKGDEHIFSGDLTVKGITKPISFPAKVKMAEGSLEADSTITVDRTIYDVRYNSLKFFSAIGDKAIDDKFTVKVNLVAKK